MIVSMSLSAAERLPTSASESAEPRGRNAEGVAYSGFLHQYIDGAWRPGRTGRTMADTDPYTNETLTEIVLGDGHDVAGAYEPRAERSSRGRKLCRRSVRRCCCTAPR